MRDSNAAPQVAQGYHLSDAEFLTALELNPVNWETRKISSTEKAAFEWAEQTSRPLANGDFSAGIQGWTPEGGISDEFGIYRESTGPAFTTYAAHKDFDTGRLYQCFKVPKDATSLRFSIKGGSDEKKLYVAIWRQGGVWKHATAHNDGTFVDVQWDLAPLRGEVVSLEIVDHARGTGDLSAPAISRSSARKKPPQAAPFP